MSEVIEFKNDLIFKPCKTCGATNYDNADASQDEIDMNFDGAFIIEPKSCDKCNFELMLSDSNELH